MKRSTTALAAMLVMISTLANAQVKQGGNQAAVYLGLANPLSNDSMNGDTAGFGNVGPSFGFNFLHQIRNHLSLGGDFNYKSLGTEDVSTGHGPLEIKSSAWTLLAIGRADLLPDNNIRPYGLVGLGVGGVKSERDYSQSPRFNAERTSAGVAIALGAGVDYDFNANWLAGAELRYSLINTDVDEIGTGSVSNLDALLKVGYKF
ncbi:MAG: outer membrane beta-barrel protein [Elusimicrobiota bacterium]